MDKRRPQSLLKSRHQQSRAECLKLLNQVKAMNLSEDVAVKVRQSTNIPKYEAKFSMPRS
jgi:hypothetical protein